MHVSMLCDARHHAYMRFVACIAHMHIHTVLTTAAHFEGREQVEARTDCEACPAPTEQEQVCNTAVACARVNVTCLW